MLTQTTDQQETNAPAPPAAKKNQADTAPPRGMQTATLEGTFRAFATGAVIAGAFAVMSIYLGLRVGFSVNLSIPAALLSVAFWRAAGVGLRGMQPFGMLEANIAQTSASAGSSVAGAGLVAAIPAYLLLESATLDFVQLSLWVFTVCLVGLLAAALVREQYIANEELPFVVGVASAETLKELYASGTNAMRRVWVMVTSAVVAAVGTLPTISQLGLSIPAKFVLPGSIAGVNLATLRWELAAQPLLIGLGGLIGLRISVSIFLGAIIATALSIQHELHRDPFLTYDWLTWTGAAMIVAASLTALVFSWRSIQASIIGIGRLSGSKPSVIVGIATIALLAVALQVTLFGIAIWLAALAILFAMILAFVAGRIAGEVGIVPSAPLAKVSQISFGAIDPANVATNTMAAGMAAGAASQGADLLNDLKCGEIVGATRARQFVAQLVGCAIGTLAGCAFFIYALPAPAEIVSSDSGFEAIGVKLISRVATFFRDGTSALPAGIQSWLFGLAIAAAVLAIIEKLAPRKIRDFVPSAASVGFGVIFGPGIALLILLGALTAAAAKKLAPTWSKNYLTVACTGLIIGGIMMEIVRLILKSET